MATTFEKDRHTRPDKDPRDRLRLELEVPKLNSIHQHLWLAGLPNAARALHRQKLLGRNILITEDPNEHLVWFETQIFIKPLPEFLLDWNYWIENLCSDHHLHKAACGLLLSYAWLVRHKSDLEIAKENGLLPKTLDWSSWVEFSEGFLNNINLETLGDVNKRYQYGELRLSRLNAIYRFIPPTYSLKNFIQGYRAESTWFRAFFERHFKWMLALFAVSSILLSALQVGLATHRLQDNDTFHSVSFGSAVMAIAIVLAGIVAVFSVWLVLFWYHLLSTRVYDRAVHRRRSQALSY